uniref:p4v protein n=1 Tax=Tenuivirus oryzabrevis TaxID=3052762 RepID=Q9QNA2_9VIRU|nr:p4v [Tenuivirus oryzabrevis]
MANLFFSTPQELRILNYIITRNTVQFNWTIPKNSDNPIIYTTLLQNTKDFYFTELRSKDLNTEMLGLCIKLIIKVVIKINQGINIPLEDVFKKIYDDRGRNIYLYTNFSDKDLERKVNQYVHCASLKLPIDFENHPLAPTHVLLWFTLIEYAQRTTRGTFQGVLE